MGNIEKFYDATIADLAQRTGYEKAYLSNIWNDMCAEGDPDFSYFVDVSFEHDW